MVKNTHLFTEERLTA